MRELHAGTPAVDGTSTHTGSNASGDPASLRERAIERVLAVCDGLSLNYPHAVTAAVPDCMPRPSGLADLIVAELARLRAPEPQGATREVVVPANAGSTTVDFRVRTRQA